MSYNPSLLEPYKYARLVVRKPQSDLSVCDVVLLALTAFIAYRIFTHKSLGEHFGFVSEPEPVPQIQRREENHEPKVTIQNTSTPNVTPLNPFDLQQAKCSPACCENRVGWGMPVPSGVIPPGYRQTNLGCRSCGSETGSCLCVPH